jgi:hypothetical protein
VHYPYFNNIRGGGGGGCGGGGASGSGDSEETRGSRHERATVAMDMEAVAMVPMVVTVDWRFSAFLVVERGTKGVLSPVVHTHRTIP